MTPKQQRFVQEYLIDLNATRAYRAAGYSGNDNVCGVEGHKLLNNPKVAAAIGAAQQRRSERTEITADRVLQELAKIGFADMRRLLKWTGNDPQMDESKSEETGDVQISVANLVTLFDSGQLDDDTAAAISEISQTKDGALKVKLHDKQAALVAIGRHLGMFKDQLDVNVRGSLAERVAAAESRYGSGRD
ncbi:terminase small subunit [Sphingomonas asaccharolytica]|uniref:terminase small subunit n=1 Tax=Sphingomonas asaccharolytica TaxID=40681 RepID=UPI000834A88E|nr:terminase small subunit [Sphingomonas asaccharolytica]